MVNGMFVNYVVNCSLNVVVGQVRNYRVTWNVVLESSLVIHCCFILIIAVNFERLFWSCIYINVLKVMFKGALLASSLF